MEETNGKTMISFQIDDDLLTAIDEIAKTKRKSRSDILRDAVTDHLKREGKMPEATTIPIAPMTKA